MRHRGTSWKADAICLPEVNEDAWSWFFSTNPIERRRARNLCFQCPVRAQCLKYALEGKEIWGVWGGCDEVELRRTLSVDAEGQPDKRSRFPHCPFCKSRPSNLFVASYCMRATGRRVEHVECMECKFCWSSKTSVTAVKAYWRRRNRERRLRAYAKTARSASKTRSA